MKDRNYVDSALCVCGFMLKSSDYYDGDKIPLHKTSKTKLMCITVQHELISSFRSLIGSDLVELGI